MTIGRRSAFIVIDRDTCYFRVLGYGLQVLDHRRIPIIFSERYGYQKCLHIGRYGLRLLRRGK